MKTPSSVLAACLLVMLITASCLPVGGSADQPNIITPASTLSPAPTIDDILTEVNAGKPPTLTTIHNTIRYLADKYPGVGNPLGEPSPELRSYLATLRGKHIEGWMGWVTGYAPASETRSIFDLSVSQDQPKPGDLPNSPVTLTDIPEAEVKRLSNWDTVPIKGPWEKIKYSGEIASVAPWGTVVIDNAQFSALRD
jgi:hypothetical protein